ncbi:MAG: AAA family ATPase [Victivallales bacterium]|nr:AAA family ATPase [Victivallales bacterium]
MADAENNHTKWLKSRKGRKFANRCKELVLRFNSPCVMPEHILLAIWDSMDIQIMFTLNESLHGKARENLELFLEELTDESSNDTRMTNTPFTTRYWEKVDELVNELDMDYSNLSEAVFLLALLYEEDSFQQYLLLSLGFTAEKLFKALKEDEPFLLTEDDAPVDGKLFSDDDSDDDASDNAEDDLDEDFWKRARGRKLRLPNEQAMENTQASDNKSSSGIPELLRPFLIDLVELAKAGKIDDVIGRAKETEEVMRVLNRKKKSAPLLIGAPGVGKTAVVEGLALRIAQGNVPGMMKDTHIYSLNVNGSISGANCRGDFEKRLSSTFEFIEKQENAILFIDELHSFLNAEAGGNHAGDAIKPEIASGKLRCIATTTDEDFRRHIAPEKAFARRFQTIMIAEPSADDCFKILQGIKKLYEQHHHIQIQDEQLKRIISLSIRYLPGQTLPDKAIDVLDTVGSKYRLHSKDEAEVVGDKKARTVLNEDIDAVICSMAKLPSIPSFDGKGNDNDFAEMATLEDKLKSKVFGQDEAVKVLVRALKISKTGLMSERAGTLGNFFFAGPTGVGKTEICKSLAAAMNMKLVRFDMSEYQSDQMLTRFIGSAPGYVGFEGGGQLTNAVRDNPNCVILLDEIEKAHSAIHNLLLQVMDDGELTDSRGFKTDFHNAILIMTSNAGCTEASAKSMRLGFGAKISDSFDDAIIQTAIKNGFSPEFRSRLTASVVFKELGNKEMERIVDHKFNEIVTKAQTRGFSVKLTDEAREKIVQKVMEAKQGARPVEKILDDEVRAPLADIIVASGKQHEFSLVLKDGKLRME